MGIKSTTTLTRQEAERLYADRVIKSDDFQQHVKRLTNEELENLLEIGQTFDNYLISEEKK